MVLYVNSNANVKALADYIVTSSTAVRVVKKLGSDVVIFGPPDSNLADYVAHMTGKRIIKVPPSGRCVVHGSYTARLVKEARARYPRLG